MQGESAFSALVDSKMCEDLGLALGPAQYDLIMMDLGSGQAYLKRAYSLRPKKRGSAKMEPKPGTVLIQGKEPNLSSPPSHFSQIASNDLVDLRTRLIQHHSLLSQQEILWHQKLRVQWLKEGD